RRRRRACRHRYRPAPCRARARRPAPRPWTIPTRQARWRLPERLRLPLLARLGLLDAVLADRPARLRGWQVFAPSGVSFFGGFGPDPDDPSRATTALAIPREMFDHVRLRGALAGGAEFRTVHVTGLLRDRAGRITGVTGRVDDDAPVEF